MDVKMVPHLSDFEQHISAQYNDTQYNNIKVALSITLLLFVVLHSLITAIFNMVSVACKNSQWPI